jgi:hypothetical protein
LKLKTYAIYISRIIARCVRVAVTVAIAVSALPVPAQQSNSAKTGDLLKKAVQFDAAQRTVEEIARSLSAQTGLTIEAESCLRERTVVIQSDRISAYDMLISIVELHDWRLEETEDHKIVIKRQIVRPATSLMEVPVSIKMALPMDLRNYLGLGVPTDSLPLPTDPGQQSLLKARRALGPGVIATTSIKFRIDEKAGRVKQVLADQLPPDIRSGDRRNWSKLEKPLQTALLIAIVVSGVQDAYSSGGGEAILAQRLYPFQVDPSRIELKLGGQQAGELMLLIGTTTSDGKTRSFDGFGGSVDR